MVYDPRVGWVKPPESHAEWIDGVISDEAYDKDYQAMVQVMPAGNIRRYPDTYEKKFDEVAYDIMSQPDATMARLAVALRRNKTTIRRWIRRHKSFRDAVEYGRLQSEDKFLTILYNHAFQPSAEVNLGLIKILLSKIHGIKPDDMPSVFIQNNNNCKVNVESGALYRDALDKMGDSSESFESLTSRTIPKENSEPIIELKVESTNETSSNSNSEPDITDGPRRELERRDISADDQSV